MNLYLVFLAGLTIGGLGCLAVQGGLLATATAGRPSLPAVSAFLLAKLVAYTLLGLLLGGFGGAVNISSQLQTYLQLAAGVYMLLVAASLLELHPVFRYVLIQPPKFLTRLIKKESRSEAFFAPVLLGAMTVFIPCGTTLAMEALAVSSAGALSGAGIMAAFTLGTMPLFLGIGFVTSILGESHLRLFNGAAAGLIIFLGLTSINGSLIALGLRSTTVTASSPGPVVQSAEIAVTSSGYVPDYLRVKAGVPVTLRLVGQGSLGCASAFRIPAYGISKNLAPDETALISFTPSRPGKIQFTCSMGMYTGIIEAI